MSNVIDLFTKQEVITDSAGVEVHGEEITNDLANLEAQLSYVWEADTEADLWAHIAAIKAAAAALPDGPGG